MFPLKLQFHTRLRNSPHWVCFNVGNTSNFSGLENRQPDSPATSQNHHGNVFEGQVLGNVAPFQKITARIDLAETLQDPLYLMGLTWLFPKFAVNLE
jgi:hypothetical protein